MDTQDLYRAIADEMPRLRRYALALTKNRERSEDLVQECVLRGCTHIDRFEVGTNLPRWLMTIMHNLFLNEISKNRVRANVIPVPNSNFESANQEGWHTFRDVSRAFDRLSRTQREVIWLACVEERDFSVIARDLNIPQGTVRSRLFRARELLKRDLDAEHEA